MISLKFIFHSLWQTFLNFYLFQACSQVAGGPEASKNSKKSAKVNEKKIQEKLSKTRYFSTVTFLLLIKKCGFEKNSYVFSYAKVVIRKEGFYRV